jgi:Mu transposase, C-terminal
MKSLVAFPLRSSIFCFLTVARQRKVQSDGVRYQGLRYIDATLAAYIGESVTVRYDPRDMAEIRVFHKDRFVCRAICPELAGETVPLRDSRFRAFQSARAQIARYAQFYSRIGFVHEFRPLNISEMRRLLTKGWTPLGVSLPALDSEAVTSVIRITGGNFRLFERLLTQIERIAEINNLTRVSKEAVEAARESLVIGQI